MSDEEKRCQLCGKKIEEGEYCISCTVNMAKQRNPKSRRKYCLNCGEEVADEVRYCPSCGNAFVSPKEDNRRERKMYWEGSVHKCPNCGEIVDAFSHKCSVCGYEFRDTTSSNAIKNFARLYSNAVTREQKISLIRGFPIPNNKEDLYEFLILAGSNIDVDAYDTSNGEKTDRIAMSNAWKAKFEQAYQKSRIVLKGDSRLVEIENLHNTIHASIGKEKRKTWLIIIMTFSILIALYALIFIGADIGNKKEDKRLEGIATEIEQSFIEGEYENALLLTDKLVYSGGGNGKEKWEDNRKYWVNRILVEAEKNGYDLSKVLEQMEKTKAETKESEIKSSEEPPVTETLESHQRSEAASEQQSFSETETVNKTQETQNNGQNKQSEGFFPGFIKGIKSGFDAAKENVEEFEKKMDGIGNNEESREEIETTNIEETEPVLASEPSYIERESVYTCGRDEYNLYVATAITDEIIKIDKWSKNSSSSTKVSLDQNIGTYKINEVQNGFQWLNDEHVAFTFNLHEMHYGFFDSEDVVVSVVFFTSNSKSDKNKGSYIQKKATAYSYSFDDWHLYRATQINEDILKIECWYRPESRGSFHYSYDVCLVDRRDNSCGFEWADENKKAFTLVFIDPGTEELANGKFVTFEVEK